MELFSTSRLVVRHVELEDVPALHSIYGDEETVRFVGDSEPLSREDCERWVEVCAKNYRTRGYGLNMVVDRNSGEAIGGCGIVHPDGRIDPEIKYALRRDRWGQGLASELVPAMLFHGLETLMLAQIFATVDPMNSASIKVLERSGMSHLRDEFNDDGSITAWYFVGSPSQSNPPK